MYDDMNIQIKICSNDEVVQVMKFIDEHWSKGHILSYSRELINWQYYNNIKDHYNFIIAKNNNEILGILGYIPTYHYDKKLINNNFTWLTTWKVREDINLGGLGLRLLLFINNYAGSDFIGTVGNNERVSNIYKLLGYTVGKLNHYYIVNREKSSMQLIGNFNGVYNCNTKMHDDNKKFILIDKNEFLSINFLCNNKNVLPYKTIKFYYNRYLKHPFYNYIIYSIRKKSDYIGFIVVRKIYQNNSSALRIVDYFGDDNLLVGMKNQFQQLLLENDSEYIDFYNYGIEEEKLKSSGFIKHHKTDSVIVPNYYEPFERRNVDINFAYKMKAGFRYYIFKGDCDQDRPNTLDK